MPLPRINKRSSPRKDHVAHDQPEDRITQKLHSLVGIQPRRGRRCVRDRALEQLRTLEPVPEHLLTLPELIVIHRAQPLFERV